MLQKALIPKTCLSAATRRTRLQVLFYDTLPPTTAIIIPATTENFYWCSNNINSGNKKCPFNSVTN